MNKKLSWQKKSIKNSITLFQILCTVHLFNEYILEIRPCTGASMYPTLSLQGDYVLHSKLLLSKLHPPPLNSLVTAISPLDPSHQVLKRIRGLPGQTICIDPSGERSRDESGRGKVKEFLLVPEGKVWLAGDNVSNSIDSRDYGPVPIGLIKGLVVARIWPSPKWLLPGKESARFRAVGEEEIRGEKTSEI